MSAGQQPNVPGYFTVTRTVGAGKVDLVDMTGNFCACLASNLASFAIALDGQSLSQFFAQGIKFKMPASQVFRQIIIDNTGNTAPLTVTLAIGIGDLTDQRFPSADPLDLPAQAGQAFAWQASIGATAAQFSALQIQNPAANGARALLIRQIEFPGAAAAQIVAIAQAQAFAAAMTMTNSSKLLGGPAAKALFFSDTNAAEFHLMQPTIGQTFMKTYEIPANATLVASLKGPIVIPPGFQLGVWSLAVNTALTVNWEWQEQ